MSYPPEDPRRPAGADDTPERPETSWLSSSLPDGAGEPAAPLHGGAPAAPTQPQPWQAGPAPYQQAAPPPGYPSGYPQQPPAYGPAHGPGAPAPKKRTGAIVAAVLAVVLVLGGGIAVWQLWPDDKDDSADTTATSAPPATCWDPDITGDCPQFAGRDAALYVFPLKDAADEAACSQLSTEDFEGEMDAPSGAVDIYRCGFADLNTSAIITQWPSTDAATNAWMYLPSNLDLPWYTFQDRWTVDGQEMGDLLVGPDVGSDNDFHVQCYDDLPFCLWTLGQVGKADTGDEGDWTLVRDKFDPLNTQEVEALNAFLDDHPSLATPTPAPTGTTAADDYEITDLNSVERSIAGQLAKGYCFDTMPDMTDALNTPTVVQTVPCTDPHLGQVVGFVDITDIGSRTDSASRGRYTERCQSLMATENVPEDLQAHGTAYVPDPREMEAGARAVLCLVRNDTPWTGSALDGTAAGY